MSNFSTAPELAPEERITTTDGLAPFSLAMHATPPPPRVGGGYCVNTVNPVQPPRPLRSPSFPPSRFARNAIFQPGKGKCEPVKGERALPCMPPLHFNSQRNHCFTSTLRPSHIHTRSTLCCVQIFPRERGQIRTGINSFLLTKELKRV